MKVEKSWEDSKSLERSPFIGGSLFSCLGIPSQERKTVRRVASDLRVSRHTFSFPIYKGSEMSPTIPRKSISEILSTIKRISEALFFAILELPTPLSDEIQSYRKKQGMSEKSGLETGERGHDRLISEKRKWRFTA